MPDLRPFRGLRYDAASVTELGSVLCPPYDVISPTERELLLDGDPRNAVRVELPARTPTSATDADYDQAVATLRSWVRDGTLRRDARPMIYVYEQQFEGMDGTSRVARGFLCELALEAYGPASRIRPHEHTIAAPREHRFRLLSAVRTHLSPVLLIYDDTDGRQQDLLANLSTDAPTAAGSLVGVEHRLWAVDPQTSADARELLDFAMQRPLTIADGHHRYETALRYRDTPGAPPGANHVLALLYGSRSGGLALAPWHRVISGVPDTDKAVSAAIQLLKGTRAPDASSVIASVASSEQPGVAGVWSRQGGAVLHWDQLEVGRLDVTVLSDTLPEMTGSTEQELTDTGRLSYTHDAGEAIAAVDRRDADVAFLLRPTPIQQVLAVAAAGEFMPPKSTYFYPKAATGLVFDPLE